MKRKLTKNQEDIAGLARFLAHKDSSALCEFLR